MNSKGQFSIMAALLVAVVLIGTVITTYATLRYGTSQEQPQTLSSVDETNLALEKVLGFTVGYYGSVLQVTGDTAYAKSLTTNYLNSSLSNLMNTKPEWGASFSLVAPPDLSANWFTNHSYSSGQAVVKYDLSGLGIYGMSYNTSSRLDVLVSNSSYPNKACLTVFKDGYEPVVNLNRQNFKFYRYQYSNLTWNFEAPSGELTTFSNGTYLITIPADIDPLTYVVQVTDTRGIMVAAASFSRITSTFMWNTTSALPAADYVDTSTVNLGTQSNFAAQQQGPDSVYDLLTEGTSGPVQPNYYPGSFVLGGSTAHVSGSLSDLQSDNGVRMVFRSYSSATSAQTLFTHRETTSIASTSYYTFRANSGDTSGLTLSAQMSSSRVLLGKSVYSLQGVSSIPASTWTANYRAWQDASASAVTFDSSSSVEAASPATFVSWSHTTGAANNRLLLVAVSVNAATGVPTTITGVTYGGVSLTQVSTAYYSSATPQVRTYVFRLLNPQSGTRSVIVNFAASTLYVCGATTYANVDQTSPIQASQTATGSSTSPFVQVSVSGSGRAVFGHLAGHRTAETTNQVTYVNATGGVATTSGYLTPSYPSGLQADDLILLQVTVRDTYYTPTTPTGFTLLYEADSTGTGRQWIYYKFSTGSETGTITITIGGSSTKIARMYAFRNVALSSFTEDPSFGYGTYRSIAARSVTTTGDKRLAVSFVFVNDNNAVNEFTGETGGDWQEAVTEYTTSTGSDGCVQLQIATMASAGTISGGNYWMNNNDPWGVRAFALKPKTTPPEWTVTEGSGQTNRWAKETNLYKARGSDSLNVAAGTATMSWTTSSAPNWACSAVVINPSISVGHCNIDVLIRKSDGTVRSTIATGVANSASLSSTAATLSGTYAWGSYTVVDQTDYLEIDYYVEVTVPSSYNAYLRIDDQTLSPNDQTRIANVMLPSEYTSEVELTGVSDTESWSQLVWATDSSCSVAGVAVTTQLYNYAAGSYPTSGSGFNSATIGTSDVALTQTITVNPADFRSGSGAWKLRFRAVSSSVFDLNIDLARYSPVPNYMLDVEEQWTSVAYAYPRQDLCIRTGSLGAESLMVDVRVGSSWVTVISSLQSNDWNNVSVTQYINSSTFAIRFRDSIRSSDPTQHSWSIDAVLLCPQPDVDALLKQLDHTMTVELLQDGTMRWLGQNLTLTTTTKPIPPIPVKAIHVNQTINGVNQEVPFQVEDWASEYSIPLGLTSNATVFSNRQMVVFLVNVDVSKVTVWWDGSDTAAQTSKAYTNVYFTGDDHDNNRLTNGKLLLEFGSGFTVTSTVSGASSTANFMRINTETSEYGSSLAYVIHHGIVRDIVQQEAEWGTGMGGGGASNCPNVYANIVLTLPANATYYTYQLRLMFIDSTQPRTITDLCPIKLSTSSVIQFQTENGTANGVPIVATGAGTFYNVSPASWTAHHWSQINSTSTAGAGIMFTNSSNQQLYAFDQTAGHAVGALRTDASAKSIELLPVAQAGATFTDARDLSWYGAVATFSGSAAPIYRMQGTTPTGLWLLVEYPPTLTVSSES